MGLDQASIVFQKCIQNIQSREQQLMDEKRVARRREMISQFCQFKEKEDQI